MPTFPPGTVVWLKSGSPKMTVSDTDAKTVWCSYFDDNKLYRETFNHEQLTDKDPNTPLMPTKS
jgi:uncharacterized protein YodC (DUF2158 family)